MKEPSPTDVRKLARASPSQALSETLALHERGQLEAVVPRYKALLEVAPEEPRLWLNLGAALQGLGRLQEAITSYERAAKHDPSLVEAEFNLGCIHRELGEAETASRHFATATRIDPGFGPAHYNLANALRRLGRPDEAIESYRASLRLRPSHADSSNGLGLALRELGDLSGAEAAFLRALSANSSHTAAFANLATVHRFVPNDPQLSLAKEMEARLASLPTRGQIEVLYALGKICDDIDDPATAMKSLTRGAALMRSKLVYDEAREVAYVEAIKAASSQMLGRLGGVAGHASSAPIFVVGMPRSGTTLVEQILANHPDVTGAGELKELGHCLEGWVGADGIDLTAGPSAATRGEAYVSAVRSRIGLRTPRFVDKMPDNFRYVGLIRLILPNAVIVHCRRAALDTCLSCFRTLFEEGHAWSYDLEELGRRFRLYQETMAYWHGLFPGQIIDVQYETLVSSPETEIRNLLERCGLEFSVSCLSPHLTPGQVRTASATQVRQPIHKGSVGRADRYRPYLSALSRQLGE